MKKWPPKLLILIVAICCFMLGILSVWLRAPSDNGSVSSPVNNSTNEDRQTTILFLGVDELYAPESELLAVWYATYRLPEKDIFLLGISIGTPIASDSGSSLRSLFYLNSEEGVSTEFFSALSNLTPLQPDVIIIADNHAFSTLVDYMGGVHFDSGELSGDQVIGLINFLSDQPDALLVTQDRLLVALSQQGPNLGNTPDLTPITALIPEHLYSSTDIGHLMALFTPLLPITPATTHVDTLTPPDQTD
jgi:hypothetical protein